LAGNGQVLNLFLALLLSSFGAESLKHSEEDEGPNKLQEAVDRINRFTVFVKSHISYCVNVYIRQRGAAFHDVDDPDAAYGYLAGPNKPHSIAVLATHGVSGGGAGVHFSSGHVHEVGTSPDGVDGLSVTSPQHHQANGQSQTASFIQYCILMGTEQELSYRRDSARHLGHSPEQNCNGSSGV